MVFRALLETYLRMIHELGTVAENGNGTKVLKARKVM